MKDIMRKKKGKKGKVNEIKNESEGWGYVGLEI